MIKVKLSVFLIEHYAVKSNGGVEVLLQEFFTSAVAVQPDGFIMRRKSPAI
jgi:hypothetical protein